MPYDHKVKESPISLDFLENSEVEDLEVFICPSDIEQYEDILDIDVTFQVYDNRLNTTVLCITASSDTYKNFLEWKERGATNQFNLDRMAWDGDTLFLPEQLYAEKRLPDKEIHALKQGFLQASVTIIPDESSGAAKRITVEEIARFAPNLVVSVDYDGDLNGSDFFYVVERETALHKEKRLAVMQMYVDKIKEVVTRQAAEKEGEDEEGSDSLENLNKIRGEIVDCDISLNLLLNLGLSSENMAVKKVRAWKVALQSKLKLQSRR